MHEKSENSIAVDTGRRYDAEMWGLAYEIWAFEADRNATRTRQKLIETFRESAMSEVGEIDEESLNIPSEQAIRWRARKEDWTTRATEDIAKLAPKMYKAFNARLFAQVEAAQAFDADVLAGRYGDPHSPGVLAVKEKVAARVQTLAAVGTAAGLMPASLPTPSVQVLDEDASTQEVGRRMREKLDALRQGQR